MKAFLLAAGEGTRLRPITNTIPKCLVSICGKPLLQIWLEHCRAFDIHEVLLNIHTHAAAVEEFVKKQQIGVEVRLVHEPELLGSAGTIHTNRSWVSKDPEFWIFYADVLNNVNLGAMLAAHRASRKAATLGLYRVDEPSRCGIAQMDGAGIIHDFVEKPSHPVGNLAFSGIILATQEFLDAVPRSVPKDIGFDVLPQLKNRMTGYVIEDYLLDIGTLKNYELAQRTWPQADRIETAKC